jgi:hypothetical protein
MLSQKKKKKKKAKNIQQQVFASVKIARRRTMLWLQSGLASVLAVASLALMSGITKVFAPVDNVGTFMIGKCSTVDDWNALGHFLLNTTGTLFLGAGNYCMQVLVAPSRAEVDRAHKQSCSLDVGIHSFGTVWKISPKREVIWFFLGAFSTLMHLL